jgi:hypothetical protein
MKKVVRLTENDLIRIVKRVISEENNAGLESQERLFTFLKGISEMSSGGGMGWIPSTGNGVKLTSNMLGKYLNGYNDLYANKFKVEIGKPLSWDLYPLNPNLFPKADGVKCDITGTGNKLYIEINGGKNYSASIEATSGGGFLTTPGSVEESLSAMKKIYDIYKVSMNPRTR